MKIDKFTMKLFSLTQKNMYTGFFERKPFKLLSALFYLSAWPRYTQVRRVLMSTPSALSRRPLLVRRDNRDHLTSQNNSRVSAETRHEKNSTSQCCCFFVNTFFSVAILYPTSDIGVTSSWRTTFRKRCPQKSLVVVSALASGA